MKDINIENSNYTTNGQITLEYLLYKIHNNYVGGEISAKDGMKKLEEVIEQLNK